MNCKNCQQPMFFAEQHSHIALAGGACKRCFDAAANRLFELWELGREYVQPWDGKTVRLVSVDWSPR